MRICERCKEQMIEDYSLGSAGIRITRSGSLNRVPIAELKCAVCPGCGRVELYIDETELFRAEEKRKEE